MRTIWLIRHGESQGNAGEVTHHPRSIALTAKGQAQAKRLAERFVHAPDLIVVSQYQRTRETAQPTIDRFPEVPVVEWPLHEFTYLSPAKHYAGSTEATRQPFVSAYWERSDPDHCEAEDAESFNQFMHRIRECLARLRTAPEPFIAVFAHGYVIKAMLCEHLCADVDRSATGFMTSFRALQHHLPVENGMIVPLLCDPAGALYIGSSRRLEESVAAGADAA